MQPTMSIRIMCLLGCFLGPMVGTVIPFYRWDHFTEYTDSLTPYDTGGAWHLWSSMDTTSPLQPDIEAFRETFSHRKVCNFCFSLLTDEAENICLIFEPCRNLGFLSSANERSRERFRCRLIPSSIIQQVCHFCLNLARPHTDPTVCNVYCPNRSFVCV